MKLSMVTVCFNAEKCIARTLDSVLNQTSPIYEYIVVDGASTDATYQIIQDYKRRFDEKGILYKTISEKDKGISDAFNKGIAKATGDLVGLINADDELLPDANENLQSACAQKKAGVYYGNCIWLDQERGRRYVNKPASHDLDRLLYNMVLIHPSTFVRRDVYEKYGVFDITYRYCMDKELLYRLHKAGVVFSYVDKELTLFRAGGVSDKHTAAVYKEGSRMALANGEPKLKVKCIEYKKLFRSKLIKIAKSLPFYPALKEWKNRRK